jgi:hypothetical protein
MMNASGPGKSGTERYPFLNYDIITQSQIRIQEKLAYGFQREFRL